MSQEIVNFAEAKIEGRVKVTLLIVLGEETV